eukprot:4300335-Alexandrium_andersonii.AAC.1
MCIRDSHIASAVHVAVGPMCVLVELRLRFLELQSLLAGLFWGARSGVELNFVGLKVGLS